MNEPIQKDESKSPMDICNASELDEACPVCKSAPGFLCRAVADLSSGMKAGTPLSWFHRARTALTYNARGT